MPQQQGLYEQFNSYRFLNYIAALKGMDKKTTKAEIERVLKIVNLQKDAHRLLGQYSGGMKQRILVAQAIMNQPDIIILDEPTAGLDPKERI
ncbi:ATP-binding cassette domain-containing protein [Thomasclavelia cocleata]|nr:ATP-binding cassette domain-containing protein [Thomasclavelia cocleata]